jgi:hypothetical protein
MKRVREVLEKDWLVLDRSMVLFLDWEWEVERCV